MYKLLLLLKSWKNFTWPSKWLKYFLQELYGIKLFKFRNLNELYIMVQLGISEGFFTKFLTWITFEVGPISMAESFQLLKLETKKLMN